MKHKLLCLALIFLLVLTTVIGYRLFDVVSYQHLHSRLQAHEIQDQSMIYQPISTSGQTRLIPYGAIKTEHDVDQLNYTYTFELKQDESLHIETIDLEVTVDGERLSETLFYILYEVHETQDVATLHVMVRLQMPSSKEILSRLNQAQVSMHIHFDIE